MLALSRRPHPANRISATRTVRAVPSLALFVIVHWHRSDLRAVDNRGLARAADRGAVVPVFVVDPEILSHAGPPRIAGMCDALASLRSWYRESGGDLVVASGDSSAVLPRLARELDAEAVGWNRAYSGLARERDLAVVAALEEADVETVETADALCHEPGSITPNEGDHYSVFSYFWRKWRDREKGEPVDPPGSSALADRQVIAEAVDGLEPVPTVEELSAEEPEGEPPTVTRERALDRLETFCDGPIFSYADDRDRPAEAATSRLSVHLKWGTLGVREVYAATERATQAAPDDPARDSVSAFQRQLAWREFYAHVLAFNPEIVTDNFREYSNPIEWREDPEELAAWKAGETGFPIVDAGMRQLRAEGWVHNRVRMIVASFLTKDLLIDWREGYDWYRERLADHETANDVGGWQWASSTGTDAQPYFRVFNPTTQGERFDPEGVYIRQHVPELAEATADEIHSWEALDPERRAAIAPDYPAPIVDHADRRERAIRTFERARE